MRLTSATKELASSGKFCSVFSPDLKLAESRLTTSDHYAASVAVLCHSVAQKCYLQSIEAELFFWVSSSGGGLFGRPATRRESGTLFNFLGNFGPIILRPISSEVLDRQRLAGSPHILTIELN